MLRPRNYYLQNRPDTRAGVDIDTTRYNSGHLHLETTLGYIRRMSSDPGRFTIPNVLHGSRLKGTPMSPKQYEARRSFTVLKQKKKPANPYGYRLFPFIEVTGFEPAASIGALTRPARQTVPVKRPPDVSPSRT